MWVGRGSERVREADQWRTQARRNEENQSDALHAYDPTLNRVFVWLWMRDTKAIDGCLFWGNAGGGDPLTHHGQWPCR